MAEENNIPTGVISAVTSAADMITRGGPRRQFKWGRRMLDYQNKVNRANAEWQLAQNRLLADEQRLYDSPKMQMARWKEARMNPHLAYSQGNPGNMNSPVTMSGIPAANFGHIDTSYPNPVKEFLGAEMMQTQMGLTNQKTDESRTKQTVMEAQASLLMNNPHMRPAYVDALVKQMESTAAIKQKEASWFTSQEWRETGRGEMTRQSNGWTKMDAQLEQLFNQVGLQKADQKTKALIIESKEFENQLKEIQVKWMKDADITPQHIYQGLLLMLSKLMR